MVAAGQNVRDVSGCNEPITKGPGTKSAGFRKRVGSATEFHDGCDHGDPVDPSIQYASLDARAAHEAGAARIERVMENSRDGLSCGHVLFWLMSRQCRQIAAICTISPLVLEYCGLEVCFLLRDALFAFKIGDLSDHLRFFACAFVCGTPLELGTQAV